MTTIDKDAKYGPVVLECVSKSDPNKAPYEVRYKNGHYSCNCRGFIFTKHRKPNGDKYCIHTLQAERIILEDAEKIKIVPSTKPKTFPTLTDRIVMNIRQYVSNESAVRQIIANLLNEYALPSVAKVAQGEPCKPAVRRIVFDD